MKDFVGCDAQISPRNRGYGGPGTCRNQNGARGNFLATGEFDALRAGQCRPLMEHFDLVVREGLSVKTFEAVNFGSDIVAQRWPVESCAIRIPPKTTGIGQIFGKMRTINQKFLGNTSTNDTGPADAIFLRDGYARAMRSSYTRSADAAGPSANNEEIIVKVGHGKFLSVHETMWGAGRIVTNSFCSPQLSTQAIKVTTRPMPPRSARWLTDQNRSDHFRRYPWRFACQARRQIGQMD